MQTAASGDASRDAELKYGYWIVGPIKDRLIFVPGIPTAPP